MKQLLCIALLSGLVSLKSLAVAAEPITAETINQITLSVIELCRGGTLEGSTDTVEISGQGNATVLVLKRLANLGISGRVELSESEWTGMQAVIPEQWDQSAYNDCVNPNVRLFIEKLATSNENLSGNVKVYDQASSAVCGDDSFVRVVIYKKSAYRAKQEAQLIGGNIQGGRVKLSVGQSINTSSNCTITLAATGFDHDFYARLMFKPTSR